MKVKIIFPKKNHKDQIQLSMVDKEGHQFGCNFLLGDSTLWRFRMSSNNRMDAIEATRFSPLKFSSILGFPNDVPTMDEWGDFIAWFIEKEEDKLAHHVIKFHQYMDQLSIHHEYLSMKMFMYSLDGCARKWYKYLPASSISSLKDFHDAFY